MNLNNTLGFLVKICIGIGAACPSYTAEKADENRAEQTPHKVPAIISTVPLKPIARGTGGLQDAPESQRVCGGSIPRPSSSPLEGPSSSSKPDECHPSVVVRKQLLPGTPPVRPVPSSRFPLRLLLTPDPSSHLNNNASKQQ